MTLDDFVKKNNSIFDRLKYISDRTAKMVLVGAAKPSNPIFSELMQAQDQLISAADKLIETYLNEQSDQRK